MSPADPPTVEDNGPIYDWSWFPRGMAKILSIPALILLSAFIGFGGLAREVGLPLEQVMFMVPLVWALPSHLLLVGGIVTGLPWPFIALTVMLAAIRMMPMVMALVPEIRAPRTKPWHLFAVSNMVAITPWVHTLAVASEIPRRGRLPYFMGFAATMMLATTSVAALVHQLAATFPPVLMAALYFLTPIYFTMATWKTTRVLAEKLALGLGFALGPLFALVVPQANILVAGFLGGAIAYGVHRWQKSRAV
ncbi:AzlC family ABC transporter permease [Ahrensia sp. R2A130]|uniref:AzlC family ABC transporter permease n=1 Tax=Ahrensia sp. R2A130 TaxID=744979 RepID=UPI0001E0BC18|nr:AzlC family ABC transporter permease [Ahrensia sp. R2A130]EFL90171.1 AzlC family protein [Ahrensia sp. R2A130]